MSEWRRNPGHLPEEAKGKRVRVKLASGDEPHYNDNPIAPPGWAADGRYGCNWTRRGQPFDIDEYLVL